MSLNCLSKRGKGSMNNENTFKIVFGVAESILLVIDSRIIPIDSISVGPLTMRFGVMNNAKLIRLASFDVRLAMTDAALHVQFWSVHRYNV